MEKYLNKGQVSKLEIKIDPSSMGAMIIRIREKYDENQDSEAEQGYGRDFLKVLIFCQ